MLNQSGITKTSGVTTKTILADTQNRFAMPCMISNTGVTAVDGKKIVKAGTPLSGSLKARGTAFTVSKKDDTTVCGIALSDVDVTNGTANGSVLVFGFVYESKMDSSVTTLLDVANTDGSKVRDGLKLITFVE